MYHVSDGFVNLRDRKAYDIEALTAAVACEFSGEISQRAVEEARKKKQKKKLLQRREPGCCARESEVGEEPRDRDLFISRRTRARGVCSRAFSPSPPLSSSPSAPPSGLHLLSRAISSYVSLFLHATSYCCRLARCKIACKMRATRESLAHRYIQFTKMCDSAFSLTLECKRLIINAHLFN